MKRGICVRLFDLHCDTLYECWKRKIPLDVNDLHIDLERGRRYDAWAQVFAVWMPDTVRGEAAWRQCESILDLAVSQTEQYAGKMRLVHSGEEIDRALTAGCCAAVLAVEGGSALAGRLEHIQALAQRGVKILTLTWNGENELGYGSGCGESSGLKPFGREAVLELKRWGIVPDVSHLNERGFWDVAELTEGAFIASHSVSAALCDHSRNLKDEQFALIRDRGGLVGLNLCGSQLGEQSFEQLERHFYHYLSLGGERTVAFGCDFDGTDLPPEWGGIQVMERLYDFLCRKNYDAVCLDRLFFSNSNDFFHRL